MYKRSFCKNQLEGMCEADLDIHTYNTQIPTQSVTAYAMQICCNTEYNNALFTIPHIREKKRENFMQRGKDVSKLVEHNCNTNIYITKLMNLQA